MFSQNHKFSDSCELQSRPGVTHLEQVGGYLIIANRKRYNDGNSRRFAVVNLDDPNQSVDSVHGSHRSALKRVERLIRRLQ